MSALGWHDLRGRLGSNGWVSVKEAAEAMQVSEEKTRVELDGSGDYVRALQGHTPDSGLSKEDFHTEELTLSTGELWTDSRQTCVQFTIQSRLFADTRYYKSWFVTALNYI